MAADAGDFDEGERVGVVCEPLLGRLGGQLEHGPVQAMPGVANGELCRVHANGNSAGTCVDVVAGECALQLLIQGACWRERERMSGDHHARAQPFADGRHGWCAQNVPVRSSKCVGFPSSRPPSRIQLATQPIIVSNSISGAEKVARMSSVLLSNAFVRSLPWNRIALPKMRPNTAASARTDAVPLPVMLTTNGGDAVWASASIAIRQASPCQMTFTWPIARGTGWSRHTRSAISTRTP